jgi:hypothetical protein
MRQEFSFSQVNHKQSFSAPVGNFSGKSEFSGVAWLAKQYDHQRFCLSQTLYPFTNSSDWHSGHVAETNWVAETNLVAI